MKAACIHEWSSPSASSRLAATTPMPGWSATALAAFRCFRVHTFHGSYWGNNVDLMEVLSLAAQDKIRHTTNLFKFEQINEYLDRIRAGEIVGRAVMNW